MRNKVSRMCKLLVDPRLQTIRNWSAYDLCDDVFAWGSLSDSMIIMSEVLNEGSSG